jgi:N-dimethylarginine dimethylaminohydrolase
MMATERRFGAQSMTSPLLDVLVKRPGPAFGAAFDDPAHGFLHPVDLDLARREHDAFLETLAALGPRVHVLETELSTPDLVYTFDPLLVTDRGAIPLRPGKPNRSPEPAAIEAWTTAAGIPTLGLIEARSRAATPSGCGLTSSASGGHCAPIPKGRASWPSSSAATCASSTSRTGEALPS